MILSIHDLNQISRRRNCFPEVKKKELIKTLLHIVCLYLMFQILLNCLDYRVRAAAIVFVGSTIVGRGFCSISRDSKILSYALKNIRSLIGSVICCGCCTYCL